MGKKSELEVNLQNETGILHHIPLLPEGQPSHPFNQAVTTNRQLLNHVMSQHGFIPLSKQDAEWWHFTLKNGLDMR